MMYVGVCGIQFYTERMADNHLKQDNACMSLKRYTQEPKVRRSGTGWHAVWRQFDNQVFARKAIVIASMSCLLSPIKVKVPHHFPNQ